MRFLPLILKSVRRNMRRTALTVGGIALSVFVITALLSVEAGFATLFDSTGESTLNVYEKGLACPISSRVYDSYLSTVASVPHVVGATGVLRGLYSYQSKDHLVTVSGVDFETFSRIKPISIREGSAQDFAARADGALIGGRLARDHGWRIGQTVSLIEDRLTFQVAGIFSSDDKSYEGGVLLHKAYLSRIKRDEGRSTFLIVTVSDAGAIAPASQAIDAALANFPKPTTTQSEKAAKELEFMSLLEIRRMLSLMLMATIVASVFGAANSVSMSVRDRIREVGILRSLGLRQAHIMQILIGESALVAAAGGAVGLAAATALLSSATTLGGVVPLVLPPAYAAAGMGIALAVGLIGAAVPSVNASRLTIVESLRFVD